MNTINEMNAILTAWKNQFDILSVVPLNFSIDERSILHLNGISLAIILEQSLSSASFDAERILYQFDNVHCLVISLVWPEDGAPHVQSVMFRHSFQ